MEDLDLSDFCDESVLQLLDEPFELKLDKTKLREDKQYKGFDNNSGDTWVYPTNYPVRHYQFNITKAALFKNTMVVLPTGLGKTFIAAVVMYNFYRWYPTGKIIFMAPTRPLVAQQIEACYQIMGIAKCDTVELTGQQNKRMRIAAWRSKRVFFVTPQILNSDAIDPEVDFPINNVKLIVVDEAHRAKGKYAYATVIQNIFTQSTMFRVLALSATPGRRIEDVAEVIRNLLISNIEVRYENSVDVSPYTHRKNIQTVVVPLGETLTNLRNDLIEIIDPYVRNLLEYNVISGTTKNLTRGGLVIQQQRYRADSLYQRHPQHSAVATDFACCISLFHALELLDRHGVRIFLNFFNETSEEKYFVSKDVRLKIFIDSLRSSVGPNPFSIDDSTMPNGEIPDVPDNLDFGHPKYEILRQHLLEHFEKNNDTRAIVFCEFRESVYLIHRLLLQNRPLIKPIVFVGKGGQKSVTQKQQLLAMADFRSGASNILIATCVAEEGIDVGEVDLIICFDISTKNPTRLVQRIGRTGRKRQGKVIMLVTEGREQSILKEVLATKDSTNKMLVRNKEITNILYKNSPRLVPPEFDPQCIETFIKVNQTIDQKPMLKNGKTKNKSKKKISEESPKKSKRKHKKTSPSTHLGGVRKYFEPLLDDEDKEVFCPSKYTESINYEYTQHETSVADEQSIANKTDNTFFESDPEIEKLMNIVSKYKKELSNDKYFKATVKVPKMEDLIIDERCPNILKKYALKNNLEFLKNHYNDRGKDEDTEVMIRDENSERIENIYGGRENVINLIENIKTQKQSPIPLNGKFSKLFQGIGNAEKYSKNFTLTILEKSFETENINKDLDFSNIQENNETIEDNYYIDSQWNTPRFMENESKYQNQYINEPSTSKAFLELKSSTPNNANITKRKKIISPSESLLAKAFQRSFEKKRNKKAEHQKLVLDFFGLTNVFDLFADDVIVNSPTPISVKESPVLVPTSPIVPPETSSNLTPVKNAIKSLANSLNKLNNSVQKIKPFVMSNPVEKSEISNIFEEESMLFEELNLEQIVQNSNKQESSSSNDIQETQYTVSQIMKIVESEVKLNEISQNSEKENLAINNIANRSIKSNKNIDIGSIDDIFCSDDDIYQLPTNDLSQEHETSNVILASQIPSLCSSKYKKKTTLCLPNNNKEKQFQQNISDKKLVCPHVNNNKINGFISAKPTRQLSDDMFDITNISSRILQSTSKTSQEIIMPHIPTSPVETSTSKSPYLVNKITPSHLQSTSHHFGTSPMVSPPLNSALNNEKTSPSVFSRKPNFSKLRQTSLRMANSLPDFTKKSTVFVTNTANIGNNRMVGGDGDQDSVKEQSFIRRRVDLSRFENKNSQTTNNCTNIDETLINYVPPKNKRILHSSSSSDDSQFEKIGTTPQRVKHINKKPKRRKKCVFVDDECAVSGVDSDDDEDDELSQFVCNTVICEDDVPDDPPDMHAKYLQSINSPSRRPGIFRIPEPGKTMNIKDIFSQVMPEDNFSTYKEDSFVVTDDEKEVEEEDDMDCPLEKAELILKQRRKQKRKGDFRTADQIKKRRKIIVIADSSDDDK